MPRKRSPFQWFNDPVKDRGVVVAVQVHKNLWCYVRKYGLSAGFLPFFSKAPLAPERLPTLKAVRHFDLWPNDCDNYEGKPTPMQFVAHFPFETKEESYGTPRYTPPRSLGGLGNECYYIHEVRDGKYGMRITEDAAEVKGMRLQRNYEPHELRELLSDVLDVWPIVDSAD
jgi:hypothetical protein